MPRYDYNCPQCGLWEGQHPYPPPHYDACPACAEMSAMVWVKPPNLQSFYDDGHRYVGKAKLEPGEMLEGTPWEGRDDYHRTDTVEAWD